MASDPPAPIRTSLVEIARWRALHQPDELAYTFLVDGEAEERLSLITEYLRRELAHISGSALSQVQASQQVGGLGLDSLMVVELQHRVEADLGVALSLADLLGPCSVHDLARRLLDAFDEAAGALPDPLAASAQRDRQYPLSYGQQALWFLHQLAPDAPAYNIVRAARLRGRLDLAVLGRAFQILVDRHPALHTTFRASSAGPPQQSLARAEVGLGVTDASGWSDAALADRAATEGYRPFDLERDLPLRVQLFERSADDRLLVVVVHHIVADLWSLAILIRELGALCHALSAGTDAALPLLDAQYADYVGWQREFVSSAAGERQRSYWREQLAGDLAALDLPTDRPRPPAQTYDGAALQLRLGGDLLEGLKQLSRANSATLYMTLLAAFQALLHRYTGQDDILVGSPTAGRSRAAFAGLVGYFVNPVVLRANLAGKPAFKALLRQARQRVLEAFEHQDYPFARLAEQLQPERDPSRSPLFQCMFTMVQAPALPEADPALRAGLAAFALGVDGAQLDLGDLRIESFALAQRAAQFDITLAAAESEDGLGVSLQYNTCLFDAATIARMLGHWRTLLEGIVGAPERRVSDLPLLRPAERQQILADWNDAGAPYPRDRCIHELFEAQAARTPAALALVFEDRQLSYGDLNRRANRLAHRLRRLGVGPDVCVGLCVERSLELIVGMLGILKAGGAYVPLAPTYPQERLSFMLADAHAAAVVAERRTLQRTPHTAPVVCLDSDWPALAAEADENPARAAVAENLAYAIYTSGSTGTPKGVMIAHRSVVNCFSGMERRVGCDGSDTLLAVTSISFDISALELLWPLARGARVVLLSDQATSDLTARPQPAKARKGMDFSLLYFASDDAATSRDKYRLLIEGAKFADEHGFRAVWTPERHFHAFGGLYPNPAVTSAALATITRRIQLRAGSVVMPLHHPVRVAEEWAAVDNLSNGRVGIAFASGWHADDFVFFPERYESRKDATLRGIDMVRQLWRGESVAAQNGAGKTIEVQIFPKPIRSDLPIWITAAGNPETFVAAGKIGANVLTHLLGQTIEDVAEKIQLYRATLREHGYDPQAGCVTLMLHTFVGASREAVREKVYAPFTNYLRSSVGLIQNLIQSLNLPFDLATISDQDMASLLSFAFDRYFETSALFGTPQACCDTIDRLKLIGVDEVACLIDFGVDEASVLASLDHLCVVKDRSNEPEQAPGGDYSIAAQAAAHRPTLMQCTPSFLQLITGSRQATSVLRSLRALLAGGEDLPAALAQQLVDTRHHRLINMYGPTETTIWSASHEVERVGRAVPIGRPIANTAIYVLDRQIHPAPIGVAGELYIGGSGLARGYLGRPDLTAERFVPNPFGTMNDEDRTMNEPHASFIVHRSSFGARLYKTGDRARYLPDGSIEFLGRTDQQVKIRGYRIELGEIAAALSQHEAVRDAVALAREDAPGDLRLVAYVVQGSVVSGQGPGVAASDDLRPDPRSLIPALREWLRARLPDYMLPSAFVALDALPLTPNGKVDRRALPAPPARHDLDLPFTAPRTPVEEEVAGIWREVLKLEQIGIHENFFALGGHSLLAVQVISRIRTVFQVDVPLGQLFEAPTAAGMARVVEALIRTGGGDQAPAVKRAARDGNIPLSYAQERLWFFHQMGADSPAYNTPIALRLTGRLDIPALRWGLNQLVERHESLRTTFRAIDGVPFQVIAPTLTLALPVADIRGIPGPAREAEARRRIRAEARRPFDLAQDRLCRATLVQLADDDFILLVTMHHIISDGWSLGIFVRELLTLSHAPRGGRPVQLANLPVQYADFAIWQRQWFQGDVLDPLLAYWKQRFAELVALELPTDRPRPPIQTFRGASYSFRIAPAFALPLKSLGQRCGVTLFMTLLAAFQLLLARYSGQDDIVVGSPVAGRSQAEIEGLIGFFANTLVLRTDLSGDPEFQDLLGRVREVCLGAYTHQDLPFEKLVEQLQPERDMSRNPLFQVMFVLQNAPISVGEIPGLKLSRMETHNGTAKFDLWLSLVETPEGLTGELEYSIDLFDLATIRRMVGHFQTLLEGIGADPARPRSALPLLTAAERRQILEEWNDTIEVRSQESGVRRSAAGAWRPASQAECIHELFEAQAARSPDVVAAAFDGWTTDEGSNSSFRAPAGRRTSLMVHLTYAELNRRANQAAHYLRALGVGPDVPAGICMERSLELVIGLLGILKAGGAYVPLDPTYPRERLRFILEDSGAHIVIYDVRRTIDDLEESHAAIVHLRADWPLISQRPGTAPASGVTPDHLAYVIYTSGSTGQPKGAMNSHRSISNRILWMQDAYHLTASDRVVQKTPFSFDVSVWEFFWPLISGARLIIARPEGHKDPAYLTQLIVEQDITTIHFVPSMLGSFLGEPGIERCTSLRRVICSGEALPAAFQERFFARLRADLHNLYGPTEAAVDVTAWRCRPTDRSDGIPIGRPIANCQIYLLDRSLHPAPIGVPGELYIGGVQIARGYLGRPDLTAERFIPNPFGTLNDEDRTMNEPESSFIVHRSAFGARLYKTGDRARYRSDGSIEFLGRLDHQVKVRGFRIEAGEIESVLRRRPDLRDAVVLAREDVPGDKRLVAYVVPELGDDRATKQSALDGLPVEQVAAWQTVFNDAYGTAAPNADPTFNIVGWNSSYTGLPLSQEEMREWVESIVERILALQPQRVLEIGCGSGLLLFRIAPHCAAYCGTDFSQAALDYLRRLLARPDLALPGVTLLHRAAEHFEDFAPESFDTVILNSVVQYFPSVEYLVRVLEGAVRVVRPGGAIVLGDLRSLPLLRAFHTSVELRRATPAMPAKRLWQRIQKRVSQEEELVLDPGFFTVLRAYLPAISHVELQLKGGRCHNELTRFRYDVILHVRHASQEAVDPPWLDWHSERLDAAAIRRRLLEAQPDLLAIRRTPNARLTRDVLAEELLASPAPPETAGQLEQALLQRLSPDHGIDPAELWALGDELGYSADIGWSGSGADGCYDVVFRRRTASRHAPARFDLCNVDDPADRPLRSYANNPLEAKLARQLAPELREYLRRHLPEYMMPAAFVLLDSLPLSPNGKLDRQALPAALTAPDLEEGFVAPRTSSEALLAKIWADVLGVEQVGVYDNFFALGGYSLLATQIISRIRAGFQVELPLRSVFEAPTIAGLIACIDDMRQAQDPRPALAPRPIRRDQALPLSFAQQRLWFLDQLQPGNPAYNISIAIHIAGTLRVASLDQSLTQLVWRHEVLRTTFAVVSERPVQIVGSARPHILALLDLQRIHARERDAAVQWIVMEQAQRPFDLAKGPLMRALLLRSAPAEHILLLVFQHIIFDGWSHGILLQDLTELYDSCASGRPPQLPDLPLQYADFAHWQRQYVSGTVLETQLAYWRKHLGGHPPTLDLPTDYRRPRIRTWHGAQHELELPVSLCKALEDLSAQEGASLFMTLLAALNLLLHRYTGQTDIVVGSPIAGRNRVEIEGLIGFFLNMLVLRSDLSGDPTVRELLRQAREAALGAYAHQDVPFEKLVQELQPERGLDSTPLFQVTFALQNTPMPPLRLPDLTLSLLEVDAGTTIHDLSLTLLNYSAWSEGLRGWFRYNTDLFEPATIARMAERFRIVLERMVADPDQRISNIQLLTDAEHDQLLEEWNN